MIGTQDAFFKTLLDPISADQPAGASLTYTPLYDAIQETKRQEDPNLPQGVWEVETKSLDWKKIESLCIEGLGQSKDLQLMAWLMEAWMKLEGLDGLTRGLTGLHKLCEAFWPCLYPLIEEGDAGARVAPFLWLDVRLAQGVLDLAISAPSQRTARIFCVADWLTAQRLETLSQKHEDGEGFLKQAMLENGGVSLATLWQSITLTPASFYTQFQQQVETCLQSLKGLEIFLNQALAPYHEETLSFFKLAQQLTQILNWCQQWRLKTTSPTSTPENADVNSVDLPYDAVDVPSLEHKPAPSLKTQSQVIGVLEEAYHTLKTQDPNGLLFLFLEQALIWRDKNFLELFKFLEEDDQIFHNIIKFLSKNKYN